MTLSARQPDNGHLLKRLMSLAVGMFFFSFALIPVCNVFCKTTGVNGSADLGLYFF